MSNLADKRERFVTMLKQAELPAQLVEAFFC